MSTLVSRQVHALLMHADPPSGGSLYACIVSELHRAKPKQEYIYFTQARSGARLRLHDLRFRNSLPIMAKFSVERSALAILPDGHYYLNRRPNSLTANVTSRRPPVRLPMLLLDRTAFDSLFPGRELRPDPTMTSVPRDVLDTLWLAYTACRDLVPVGADGNIADDHPDAASGLQQSLHDASACVVRSERSANGAAGGQPLPLWCIRLLQSGMRNYQDRRSQACGNRHRQVYAASQLETVCQAVLRQAGYQLQSAALG